MTSSSDCSHCSAAAANPLYGGYQKQCLDCNVRLLANGPRYAYSAQEKRLLPDYQKALRGLFGEDWRAGHEKVKAAKAAMKGTDAAGG